jgi:hypothetical protein
MFRSTFCVFALLLASAGGAYCETINLGIINFDVLTPAGAGPGVSVFNILNLTGDPLLSGFALPPDFPVITSLILLGGTLTLEDGGPSIVVDLGAIDPGPYPPIGSLQFPDTIAFTSAILSATLNQTSLLLADGTTFVADSPSVLATILPSGSSLAGGSDFAVISITGSIASTQVPEAATAMSTMAALGLLQVISRPRRIR